MSQPIRDSIETCFHMEKARFLDEKDGTEVCMDCGLVLQDYLPAMENLNYDQIYAKRELEDQSLAEKIRPFGVRLSQADQKILLLDWIENGHLPVCIVDQTWNWSKQMIRNLTPETIHQRDQICFNLIEFSAVAMYQVLYKTNSPRSLTNITRITGVTEKKLWRICRMFPLEFDYDNMKPSNWMPGLFTSLPVTFKESVHIGKLANYFQQDHAFNPLSLLTIAIYAYLEHRKKMNEKRNRDESTLENEENAVDYRTHSAQTLSKSDLRDLTGVSVATITRGYRKIIEENTHFNHGILYFKEPAF